VIDNRRSSESVSVVTHSLFIWGNDQSFVEYKASTGRHRDAR